MTRHLIKCLLLCVFAFFTLEAAAPQKTKKPKLVSIQIVDRNGFSETINLKDRLEQFEKANFLQPQSYQKVMRTYERNASGDVPSYLTSYYPNGQIKQYLEIINSRAMGLYQEWYGNGQKKLAVTVIGGQADFEDTVQAGWMFDGASYAYTEEGVLSAKIEYSKGVLDGKFEQFYPNGTERLLVDYKAGVPNGHFLEKYENGQVARELDFEAGVPHGEAKVFWPDAEVAAVELFDSGFLKEGIYHPKKQDSFKVEDGRGKRLTLLDGCLHEIVEIREGVPFGKVWLYMKNGKLESIYHTKNGQKTGEEIVYYPNGTTRKLVIEWSEDSIHGIVKSYYPNGTQMSQKEMAKNKKNGMTNAWYLNGDIMFIEEYENDILQKGRYFKKGESRPISTVEKGTGIATLYDPEGTFGSKITYEHGVPVPN